MFLQPVLPFSVTVSMKILLLDQDKVVEFRLTYSGAGQFDLKLNRFAEAWKCIMHFY